MEDGKSRRRRRRRTRRRRRRPEATTDSEPTDVSTTARTAGADSKPAADGSDAAPAPKPPRSRPQPEARKPRANVPHPDRAGITTSMATRAREVSPPDG